MKMKKWPTRVLSRFAPHFFWSRLAGNGFRSGQRHQVVISGLGEKPYLGGKVDHWTYLPPFCNRLAERSVGVRFAPSASELAKFTDPETCFIHVYREVTEAEHVLDLLPPVSGRVHFNHPKSGVIIAEKSKSHEFLSGVVRMPARMNEASGRVFSNDNRASGASVNIVDAGGELDATRYNTEFIDSRVTYEGKEYYTSVRLMCVGRRIVKAFCRARPVTQGSPSVHSKDTPLDGGLLEYLQAKLVVPYEAELARIAEKLEAALGPGFYSHDLVTCAVTGKVYLVEPGYKFSDGRYVEHLRPVSAELPSYKILFTDEFAIRSADLLVEELDRLKSERRSA